MDNTISHMVSKPDIHPNKNEISALHMCRVITNNRMADLAENIEINGIEYRRSFDDLIIFMDYLIEELENRQALPEEGYTLINEITEKAISSNLSANKLEINKNEYKEGIQYLLNLKEDNLPYPESTYELILILLKFFKKEQFNTKHRHFRLPYKGNEKTLTYHYGINSYLELLPTAKFLYRKYKDTDKVIDALILLSLLPYEKGMVLIDKTVEIAPDHKSKIKEAYKSSPPKLDLIPDGSWELFIKILKRNSGGARRPYKTLRNELEKYLLPILNELKTHTVNKQG